MGHGGRLDPETMQQTRIGRHARMSGLCASIGNDSEGRNNLQDYTSISACSHSFSLPTNMLVQCLHSTVCECNHTNGGTLHSLSLARSKFPSPLLLSIPIFRHAKSPYRELYPQGSSGQSNSHPRIVRCIIVFTVSRLTKTLQTRNEDNPPPKDLQIMHQLILLLISRSTQNLREVRAYALSGRMPNNWPTT